MKNLSRSQFTQVSIMLFGLFFGAGNLIFPPFLGNQAGNKTLISLLAFSVDVYKRQIQERLKIL